MKFESISKLVSEECRRIKRNKKMEKDVKEAFETAVEYDEIPAPLQKKFETKIFFSDGPEVTTPADEFVVDY